MRTGGMGCSENHGIRNNIPNPMRLNIKSSHRTPFIVSVLNVADCSFRVLKSLELEEEYLLTGHVMTGCSPDPVIACLLF